MDDVQHVTGGPDDAPASDNVIAFPRALDPAARLRLSLASVQAALAEQRAAVAAFRDSIGELRDSVSGLRSNLGRLEHSLAGACRKLAARETASR